MPSATSVRIRIEVAIAPSGPIQPSAPVYGPRRTGSSSRRISIARIFGAPVIEPPGNAARKQVERIAARVPAGRSPSRRGAGRRPSARAGTGAAPGPCPGRQTRPRSLRRTSTIITFSARSLAEREELAGQGPVLVAGPAARPRALDRIGRDDGRARSTERNGSGEAERIARGRAGALPSTEP